jgi:hypothetical protein
VLTSDGVDIGCVDQVMRRAGSPPCLVLSIGRAARPDDASVVVTAADVAVEGGAVRLRHVAQDDLGIDGSACAGTYGDEREPGRLRCRTTSHREDAVPGAKGRTT